MERNGSMGARLGELLSDAARIQAAAVEQCLGLLAQADVCRTRGDRAGMRAELSEAVAIRGRIVGAVVERLRDPAGPYRICEIADPGGSGAVLRARGESGDLAIKIHLHPLADPSARERLEERIREWAAFAHDRIVPVRCLGLAGPFLFAARPFIEGKPLLRCPRLAGRARADKVLVIREIAGAIDFVRRRGVPCGLKASWCIVDDAGEPHLVDFGLFRAGLRSLGLWGGPAFSFGEGEEAPEEAGTEAVVVRALGGILWRLVSSEEASEAMEAEAGGASGEIPPSGMEELRAICARSRARGGRAPLSLGAFTRQLDWFLVQQLAEETLTTFAKGDVESAAVLRRRLDAHLTSEEIDGIAERIAEASGGRYRDLRCLDKGGMGIVFLAHDADLDVLRAIKVPLHGFASEETRREAARLAKLRHPRIVTVHELRATESVCFFVMDYLPGPDLSELYKEVEAGARPPFSRREAAGIVRDVAEAVAYLHEQDPPVIHYDIKPRNVKIVDLDAAGSEPLPSPAVRTGEPARKPVRWEPMLLDFGICRRVGEGPPEYGTPLWIAPERRGRGARHPVGPPSDVWNLGKLLWFLLTGDASVDTGFPEEGAAEEAVGPREEAPEGVSAPEPASVRLRRRGVPRRLARIAERCLQRDPSRRPTARKVAGALDTYVRRRLEKIVGLAAGCVLVALVATAINRGLPYVLRPVIKGVDMRSLPAIGEVDRKIRGENLVLPLTVYVSGRAVEVKKATGGEASIRIRCEQFGEDYGPLEVTVEKPWSPWVGRLSRAFFRERGPIHFDIQARALNGRAIRSCASSRTLFGPGRPGVVAILDPRQVAFFRVGDGDVLEVAGSLGSRLSGSPHGVETVDLDGDGLEDLLIGTSTGPEVWRKRADGGFERIPLEDSAELKGGRVAVAVDILGDSLPEVAVYIPARTAVRIYENQSGSFKTWREVKTGGKVWRMARARFRGAGKDELLAISTDPARLQIAFAEDIKRCGAREALKKEIWRAADLYGTPVSFIVGDYNDDGHDDVGVAYGIDEVYFFRWDPEEEKLVREDRSQRTGFFIEAAATADLDGDGKKDLVGLSPYEGDFIIGAHLWTGAFEFELGPFLRIGGGELLSPEDRPSSPLVLGDLDGDGLCDGLVAFRDHLISFGGVGEGRLQMPLGFPHVGERILEAADPQDAAAVDLDGDGLVDIASVTRVSGELLIYRGTKDGFADPEIFPVRPGCRYLDIADLDGDDFPDCIVSNFERNELTVFWGSPAGIDGQSRDIPLGFGKKGARHFVVEDLDGDRVLDICVAKTGDRDDPDEGEGVIVIYGLGGRNLSKPALFRTTGPIEPERRERIIDAPRHIAVADVSGDGKPDILVNCEDTRYPDYVKGDRCSLSAAGLEDPVRKGDVYGKVAILVNEGERRFTLGRVLPATCRCESEPEMLRVLDLGRGGGLVLIISSRARVILRRNTGPLEFESVERRDQVLTTDAGPDADPEGLWLADVNRDGKPDLIVADEGSNHVFVFLNTDRGLPQRAALCLDGQSPQTAFVIEGDPTKEGWLVVVNRGSDTLGVFKPVWKGGRFEYERFGRTLPARRADRWAGPEAVASFRWRRASEKGEVEAIAVADEEAGRVVVLSRGVEGWEVAFATGDGVLVGIPHGLAVTDLDTDGLPDLVVWTVGSAENRARWFVLLGRRGERPYFDVKRSLPLPGTPRAVVARASRGVGTVPLDADGDEHPDVAVLTSHGDRIGVFFGDGQGGFSRTASWKLPEGSRVPSLIALDRGGTVHRIVALDQETPGAILLDGGRIIARVALGGPPIDGCAGDFTGDGRPDIAFLQGTPGGQLGIVVYRLGEDGFVFVDEERLDPDWAWDPRVLRGPDLNQDGLADFLLADPKTGVLRTAYNDGKGFGQFHRTDLWGAFESLVVDDVVAPDGGRADGYPDMITTGPGGTSIFRAFPIER